MKEVTIISNLLEHYRISDRRRQTHQAVKKFRVAKVLNGRSVEKAAGVQFKWGMTKELADIIHSTVYYRWPSMRLFLLNYLWKDKQQQVKYQHEQVWAVLADKSIENPLNVIKIEAGIKLPGENHELL